MKTLNLETTNFCLDYSLLYLISALTVLHLKLLSYEYLIILIYYKKIAAPQILKKVWWDTQFVTSILKSTFLHHKCVGHTFTIVVVMWKSFTTHTVVMTQISSFTQWSHSEASGVIVGSYPHQRSSAYFKLLDAREQKVLLSLQFTVTGLPINPLYWCHKSAEKCSYSRT